MSGVALTDQELLLRLAGSPNSQLVAITHVGESGQREFAAAIVQIALRTTDSRVQVCAASTLGKLRYRPAVPLLARQALHPNPRVAAPACTALGVIGGADAEDALRAARDLRRRGKLGGVIRRAFERMDGPASPRVKLQSVDSPPASADSAVRQIVEELEGLDHSTDLETVVLLRARLQQMSPGYFDAYMAYRRSTTR